MTSQGCVAAVAIVLFGAAVLDATIEQDNSRRFPVLKTSWV